MSLRIYCDGGCLNNHEADKREAYGSFAVYENLTFITYSTFKFNKETNNVAEYLALEKAIEYLLKYEREKEDITISTDSQLLIGHLTQNWKIKKELSVLVNSIKQKIAMFSNLKLVKITGKEMKMIIGH